jgi:glycosyltransferase involved in cell wall biosynthesis
MKILLLPPSLTSPAARFRLLQFAMPLRELGHEVEVRVIHPGRYWRSGLPRTALRWAHHRAVTAMRLVNAFAVLRDAGRFDVIWVNRDLLPELRILWLESWLMRRNPRVIFDFDDAIFLGPRDAKLRHILPHFAAVTAGNETLARFAQPLNANVAVFPTVVDTDYYRPAGQREPGALRIGWTGSAATLREHLPLIQPAICRLAEGHEFEFVIICDQPLDVDWPGVKTRFVRWNPETEAEDLRKIDLGVMPLPAGAFAAAKCGTKALLYMAAGIPAVVSPVGVNSEIVVPGETGFHCADDGEWRSALAALLGDAGLRHRLGNAGRERVERLYSKRSIMPKLLSLLDQVAHGERRLATEAVLSAGAS